MRRLLLTLVTGCMAIGAGAAGLQGSRLNFEANFIPQGEFSSMAQLQFTGQWQNWFLLNEPVINCTASWTNNDVLNVTAQNGSLVRVEPGEAEVYNLLLMAQMMKKDPTRTASYYALVAFCDAGVVAQNGRSGLNVAGSPNWDRFLCREPRMSHLAATILADKSTDDYCLALGGEWLNREQARAAATEGLRFREVQILKAGINASDAIRRVEKLAWRQQSFAYKHRKAQALAQQIQFRHVQLDPARSVHAHSLVGKMRVHGNNPAPEHLREYDAVLNELRTLLADNGEFEASWQENEQALVTRQLEHVRAIDRELRRADAIVASYRQQLDQRKAKEPAGAEIEPSLEVFHERGGCGVRKPGGVVVRFIDSSFDCYHQEELDVYMLEASTGSSACVYLLDHDGSEILQKCAPWISFSNVNAGRATELSALQLVAIDNPASLYSLIERQFVFDNPFPYPRANTGTANGGSIPDLWDKNGRVALRISSHMPGCHNVNGPQFATGAHFFFLDTMTFEDKLCNGRPWDPFKELRH